MEEIQHLPTAVLFALEFQEDPEQTPDSFAGLVKKHGGVLQDDLLTYRFPDGSTACFNPTKKTWSIHTAD